MSDYTEYFDKVKSLNEQNSKLLEEYISELNPNWLVTLGVIEDFNTLVNVYESGCASGAYMPAVTYYDARQALLADSGDEMCEYAMEFIDEIGSYESLLEAAKNGINDYAAFIASTAVEVWVDGVQQNVLDKIEELLESQNEY